MIKLFSKRTGVVLTAEQVLSAVNKVILRDGNIIGKSLREI